MARWIDIHYPSWPHAKTWGGFSLGGDSGRIDVRLHYEEYKRPEHGLQAEHDSNW
jgi:hypothetical protein